jgi:hypothetical protein
MIGNLGRTFSEGGQRYFLIGGTTAKRCVKNCEDQNDICPEIDSVPRFRGMSLIACFLFPAGVTGNDKFLTFAALLPSA